MTARAKADSTLVRPRVDRRDLLLAAAVEFFDSVPFDEVTVDSVAERAGVARGLVAYYFGNKEGLYRAARHEFDESLRDRQRRNPHSEPVPWLEQDVRTFLQMMEDHPAAMRNTMLSPFARSPDSAPMASFTIARIMDVLRPAINDPLLETVIASWGIHCIDLALRWLDHESALEREDVVAVMVAELRAGISAVARHHPELNIPHSFLL